MTIKRYKRIKTNERKFPMNLPNFFVFREIHGDSSSLLLRYQGCRFQSRPQRQSHHQGWSRRHR